MVLLYDMYLYLNQIAACVATQSCFVCTETTEDMPPLEGEDDDDTSKMEEVD